MEQPSIFISYSRSDTDFAHTLADHLRDRQLAIWLDTDNIADGARWIQTIQAAVEECAALVVVMSRPARESEWVERETLLALQLRKPVFIALIEDVPLPLHLITRQYTDFISDYDTALDNLALVLRRVTAVPVANTNPRPLPDAFSPDPNEANFFAYIKQMKQGESTALLARDLYDWAQKETDDVIFGGKQTPAFHAKIAIGKKSLTVISVLAYLRNPSVQIPFDYLQKYPPFTREEPRLRFLARLNALLPESEQFADERASRRPTVPLTALDTADRLEAFKTLLDDLIAELRD